MYAGIRREETGQLCFLFLWLGVYTKNVSLRLLVVEYSLPKSNSRAFSLYRLPFYAEQKHKIKDSNTGAA